MRSPEMRKKRRLRSVCAPHRRPAGTSMVPKLSFSRREPLIAALMLLLLLLPLPFFPLLLFRPLLLAGDFGMYLGHVDGLRLGDDLLQRLARECARLLEQDHFLAKHH